MWRCRKIFFHFFIAGIKTEYSKSRTMFSDNLSFSLGLRYTNFNLLGPYDLAEYDQNGKQSNLVSFNKNETVISYNNFEPRLGGRIQLGKDSSLKISYAKINQYIQNGHGGLTNFCSWSKNGYCSSFKKYIIILLWNHASYNNHNVFALHQF